MGARIAAICVGAVLLVAAFAPAAGAQQISPGGPNAQVSEYIQPGDGGGAIGPSGEVGAAGEVPFTGLTVLPLVLVGVALGFGGLALQRRRKLGPASL